MGLFCSGYIRILAGFFHIWSNLNTFSPLTPLPLSLKILSPGERLERLFLLLCLSDAAASFLDTATPEPARPAE
jgi:hypothetical protein